MSRPVSPPPSLNLGQKAFISHLERLLETHGELLGAGEKRIGVKLNPKGELVIAVIVSEV